MPKRPDDVSYMRGWFRTDHPTARLAHEAALRYVKAFNERARALL